MWIRMAIQELHNIIVSQKYHNTQMASNKKYIPVLYVQLIFWVGIWLSKLVTSEVKFKHTVMVL